uniref:Pollen-specific leucine-rich repeat extensin-like protein 3 n=1 Tax=Callorhinus ursinus TaxID=34884 RepID=A0A3Q7NW71_CALUR|nr:pollen-specific leucine-rich repeat extensin-like protein 3 [Callorhinus ursinus]
MTPSHWARPRTPTAKETQPAEVPLPSAAETWEAGSPGSPPPGGHSAPGQPGSRRREQALSAPFSSAAVAAGCAPCTPHSPGARRASSLLTCPRLRRAGSSALPVPHHHHTHGDYSPHSRLPHSPPQSSRRAGHAGEHSRAHSAHYRNRSSAQPASPRNFQRPPRNFSQLHHGCPPPPPLWLPPSLPPTPNPRNKPRLENAPIPSPPPPIPRSPSHTRD